MFLIQEAGHALIPKIGNLVSGTLVIIDKEVYTYINSAVKHSQTFFSILINSFIRI